MGQVFGSNDSEGCCFSRDINDLDVKDAHKPEKKSIKLQLHPLGQMNILEFRNKIKSLTYFEQDGENAVDPSMFSIIEMSDVFGKWNAMGHFFPGTELYQLLAKCMKNGKLQT